MNSSYTWYTHTASCNVRFFPIAADVSVCVYIIVTKKGAPTVFTTHRWMASKEELVVSNSYVYNHYQDGKEANYFLSTDRINAVAVLPLNKVYTPLLLPAGFSFFLI